MLTIGNVQLRHAEPTDAIAVAQSMFGPGRRRIPQNFGSLNPLKPHMTVLTESGVIRGFATIAPAQDVNMPVSLAPQAVNQPYSWRSE